MQLFNESRPLRVFADSKEIATYNRIKANGRANMTLLPDFYEVEIYNVSDEDTAIIKSSKKVSVYVNELSLIFTGFIEDVYTHEEGSNIVTSISVNDGMDFWSSKVNMAVGKGSYMKDVLQKLIGSKQLGAFMVSDVRLDRGQAFVGGIMDYINYIAKSVNGRAFITQNVLFVVEKGKYVNLYRIEDKDVITTPSTVGDVLILKPVVNGYSVGGIVIYENVQYRIIAQSINLDNMDGDWEIKMILVNENNITKEEMGGGW